MSITPAPTHHNAGQRNLYAQATQNSPAAKERYQYLYELFLYRASCKKTFQAMESVRARFQMGLAGERLRQSELICKFPKK